MIKAIDKSCLDSLLAESVKAERKRTHMNLHPDMADPIHRFCVAADPSSVFPIHRHPGKWELVVLLRGDMTISTFDAQGNSTGVFHLSPDGECSALELDETVFHQMKANVPSVFLEIKPGPYLPAENAPWA